MRNVPLETQPGQINKVNVEDNSSRLNFYIKKLMQMIIWCGLFILLAKITNFREKVLHDVRINRFFLKLFEFSSISFMLFDIYFAWKLSWSRPPHKRIPVDKWDEIMPKQFYTMTALFAISIISFIGAMWRTFQLMTFPLGFTGFMAVISILM